MRRALALLTLLAAGGAAVAETIPPGDYSDAGRVVRTSAGTVELFDGHSCMLQLNDALQEQLAPHMGKFVRVDYTRVEGGPGMAIDAVGAPIAKIRKITTIAKDAAELPVTVTVRALADPVRVGDPIRIRVTFTNDTDTKLSLDRGYRGAHLLRDYRWALSLAPEDVGPGPRGDGKLHLPPGQEVVREMASAWMAEPGRYDLVFAAHHPDLPCDVQSEPVTVTVLPPRDKDEEVAALRGWLKRASPTQRVEIAERLLAAGDECGIDEVLRLFEEQHEWGSFTYGPVYRFLWQHGGKRGEKAMLAELDRNARRRQALRVIEEVYRSPRRIALLGRLLADRREVSGESSTWCEHPRICDVTAHWLVGYTNDEMTFPTDGTLEERNAAVDSVLDVLRKTPKRFSVLD